MASKKRDDIEKDSALLRVLLAAAGAVLLAVAAVIIIWAVTDRRTDGGGGAEMENHDGVKLDELFPPLRGPKKVDPPDWVEVDLIPVNDYSRPGKPLMEVTGVVVHYVANPGTTARQNRNYFANLAKTEERYASSHFIVDTDGSVIQCVPLDEIAYASSGANSYTVSIECCHPDKTGKFTDEELETLTKLLRWLMDVYHLKRDDIIRHYDVTGKICPKYFVDNPEEWEKFRDSL